MRLIRVFVGAVTVLSVSSILHAQIAEKAKELTAETSASPELVGQMTQQLGISAAQAQGGAGALLGLAKTRLKPEEFGQVSSAIPGTDALLKAAPAPKNSGMAGMLGSSGVGGLASVAGAFKQLGLSPDTAAKMVPVLGKFVESKGSAAVSKLLLGALK